MSATVVTIASRNGGVGKSTIAKELSISLGEQQINNKNIKVCLLDLNLRFGGEASLLTINPSLNVLDLIVDVRKDPNFFNEENWQKIEKYFTYMSNLNIFTLLSGRQLQYPVSKFNISKAEIINIIDYLKIFFDYIIIDTDVEFNEVLSGAFSASDKVYMVIVDDISDIDTTASFMRSIVNDSTINPAKISLILNKASKKNQFWKIDDINGMIRLPVAAKIPLFEEFEEFNTLYKSLFKYKGDKDIKNIKEAFISLRNDVQTSHLHG